MKLKQIAIAGSLFLSCHLAIGATYDLADEQQFDLSDPFSHSSTLNGETDNSPLNQQSAITQTRKDQLKQEYFETLELLKTKQFAAAETKIQTLIQQNPKQSAFYNLRGLLESVKKENQHAILSFQKSIQFAPQFLSPHIALATLYLSTGELTQAKKYTDSALAIDDQSAHTYILLAKIAYQENKQQEIESILLNAQKKVHGNRQQEIIIANNLAKLYALQKQAKKTLILAQDIIKRYPNDSSALALLANAQIFNDQPEQAIPTLEQLTRQENKDSQHRLLLANLLLNKPGKKQQILTLLNEASAISPDNVQIQVKKTSILLQLKLFPEALNSARKVKPLAPDLGLAEALEGDIYLAEKKMGPALTAFQKSYSIKPNVKVMNVITKIMLTQGKQSDAINFLEQELKNDPKNLSAHFTLGNIYQQQNNTHAAEKHYLAILAEHPDNVVILNNLAWIYHLQNNPKALELAERAYTKAPQSADIADTYASILIKQGELTKGLKIFAQAGKLAPQNYDIQYHMADAYVANGQTRQALQILKTITGSEQKFSEKEAAINLLRKLES